MRALSLFSGIGGLDLAAEAAGIQTVAMCEIDPFCRQVLAEHWPHVHIYKDIFNVRGDDIGSVGIIHGGPPCQPFSVDGKQKGRDDDRYMLDEVSRLVGEIEPLWFVFENVPGILKIAADDFCTALEGHGYSVGVWCYEAISIRAHHRRMRTFFVGCRNHADSDGSRFGRFQEYHCEEIAKIPEMEVLQPDADGLRDHLSDPGRPRLPDIQGGTEGAGSNGGGTAFGLRRSDAGTSGRSCAESRLGLCPDALSDWLVGSWERGIPRTKKREKKDAKKLKALGNAVDPRQVFPIFHAIAAIESNQQKILVS